MLIFGSGIIIKAALVGAANVFLLQHVPCSVSSGHNGVIVKQHGKQKVHPVDAVYGNKETPAPKALMDPYDRKNDRCFPG